MVVVLPTSEARHVVLPTCRASDVGSTTRFLHDRTKEHLANDNSSVKKHLITHHRINNRNIEVKVKSLVSMRPTG